MMSLCKMGQSWLICRRFNLTPDGSQQIHVAFGSNSDLHSDRHACLRVGSPDHLLTLQQRIWEHHQRGGDAAPLHADKPGEQNSGRLFCSLFVLF